MLLPTLDHLIRVLIVTPLAYACAVAAVRLSGPRSLAKLNAFDLVVTVALGSVLASTITSSDLPLTIGVLGIVLLLLLQVAVSLWTSHRKKGDGVVRAEPRLLVRHGELLADAVVEARLSQREVMQAIRSGGHGGVDQVAAVLLESDGTLSVIGTGSLGDGTALDDVEGWVTRS